MFSIKWALSLSFLMLSMSASAFASGEVKTLETVQRELFQTLGGLVFFAFLAAFAVLFWAGLLSFSIAGRLLWPERLHCIEETLRTLPKKAFLLGVTNILGLCIILLFLRETGLAGPFLLFSLLFIFYFTLKGAPALFQIIGEKMAELLCWKAPPLLTVLIGSLPVVMISFLPIAGQIIASVLLVTSFGGSLLSTFTVERKNKLKQPDQG